MNTRAWQEPAAADLKRYRPEIVFEAGERNHHISNTSYPIGHTSTWKPYRVNPESYRRVVIRAFQESRELCLYAHIPFCEVRCSYCEYTVVGKNELAATRQYMTWLNRELALYRDLLETRRRTLYGFDIGGGTPSFVAADLIAEFIENVRDSFQFAHGAGISIETTPKIAAAEPAKLEAYTRAGIERISMGIQVIEPDLLRVLNRSGNGIEHHRRAVENVRRAGFRKFNIDLMYGFADQSIDSWRATLDHAINLNPEYITLYRMRYKLTRISDQAPRVTLEAVRAQAKLAKALLADSGYQANPGKNTYSRIAGDVGTSDYLTRRVIDGMPYLGLGLGAQTFTHTTISYNDGSAAKNLAPYRRSVEAGKLPLQDLYDLPLAHMMAKMVAVSFYFGEIDRAAFRKKFGLTIEEAFPNEVEFLAERGLMRDTGRALGLTDEGARHFNGVIACFFAPSIQKYLIDRNPESAEDMNRNRKIAESVARQSSPLANTAPGYASLPACSGEGERLGTHRFQRAAVTESAWVRIASSVHSDGEGTLEAMRTQERVDFANILFAGPCNRDCPFCIGKLMPESVNRGNLDLFPPFNLDAFINEVNRLGIAQIVFTGTTTDPQLYRHEAALLRLLRERVSTGARYSVHTNGVLALKKLEVFNQYDRACISFPSFLPDTYNKMMGSRAVPDLERILERSQIPVKVSCVVNEHNVGEIDGFVSRCRRIGVKRLVLRRLYGETQDWPILLSERVTRSYRGNPVYDIDGMEVTYWDFDAASSTSINLFADGTIGNSYLLAETPQFEARR